MALSLVDSCRESLAQKPYDKGSIKKFEEFLTFGASNEVYDFDIVKALFKLYATFPEESKVDSIATGLAMSLMKCPSIDFVALSCLVPSRLQKKDSLRSLYICAERLESCKFVEFWALRNDESVKSVFNNIKGFDTAIRQFILNNIQQTCKNIAESKLQSMLGFSIEAECRSYISSNTTVFDKTENGVVSFKPASCLGANSGVQQQGKGARYDEAVRFLDIIQ